MATPTPQRAAKSARRAWVTGASTGIGAAFARRLARGLFQVGQARHLVVEPERQPAEVEIHLRVVGPVDGELRENPRTISE